MNVISYPVEVSVNEKPIVRQSSAPPCVFVTLSDIGLILSLVDELPEKTSIRVELAIIGSITAVKQGSTSVIETTCDVLVKPFGSDGYETVSSVRYVIASLI